MNEPWLLGIAFAFIVIHLLGLSYLILVRGFMVTGDPGRTAGENSLPTDASPAGRSVDEPGAEAPSRSGESTPRPSSDLHASVDGDDAVRCPACEVINDASFRFCRNCVHELDADRRQLSPSHQPSGRGLL